MSYKHTHTHTHTQKELDPGSRLGNTSQFKLMGEMGITEVSSEENSENSY